MKQRSACFRVCVQKCVTDFIIDLNNTDPDRESLKTRPMKTAPLFCGSVQRGPLPCANAAGLAARHKLTHTPSPHICAPSAVVETLWTVTSSF